MRSNQPQACTTAAVSLADLSAAKRLPKSYADVEEMDVESLWPGFIPMAEPTFLVGTGGVGKGFLVSDLVARVTRGARMPDGSEQALGAGNVILIQPEDDPSTAIVKRLKAASADLSRVYPYPDDFSLPDSIAGLHAFAKDVVGDVRLIVIDPLSAVSSVALSSGPVKIRRITNALERMADDSGAALLIVHHFTKDAGKSGTSGISGSKVWTDAARVVLSVMPNEVTPQVRTLRVLKSNISSDASVVNYTIAPDDSDPEHGTPHVVYLDDQSAPDDGGASTNDRIMMLLDTADDALDSIAISDSLRISNGSARVSLSRLTKEGRVYRPARGLYAAVRELHAVDSI